MAKKITVTLTGIAEQQFAEVAYSLEGKRGPANNSEVIQHCLTECFMFEQLTQDQISNYLQETYREKYKKLFDEPIIVNPMDKSLRECFDWLNNNIRCNGSKTEVSIMSVQVKRFLKSLV